MIYHIYGPVNGPFVESSAYLGTPSGHTTVTEDAASAKIRADGRFARVLEGLNQHDESLL